MAIVHIMPELADRQPREDRRDREAEAATMPTRPFMLARRSSGTSSVTQVDNAIPRALSTMAPRRMRSTKTQNGRLPITSSELVGTSRKIDEGCRIGDAVTSVATTITRFLRLAVDPRPERHPDHATSSM